MNINSVISFPIYTDPVVPNDWDKWWNLWNNEAIFLKKIIKNHNNGRNIWKGFDIYVRNHSDTKIHGYESKKINCENLFPSLFDNLNNFPMKINVVRAVSSGSDVLPHNDYNTPMKSLRSLLFDNNKSPNFYYIKNKQKVYQKLPNHTNTWVYNDHVCQHGTDFYKNHFKILLIYYGVFKEELLQKNFILAKKMKDCIYVE